MTRLVLAAVALAMAVPVAAQAPRLPERAVRRDIPMTNAIRRAHAAGTRDSTGRPGRTYWQLRTDYTIYVRLNGETMRLDGEATIALHNASPDTLREVALRLPANHFRFGVPRAAPWVPAEETDGMVVTRVAVDGQVGEVVGGAARASTPGAVRLLEAWSTAARLQLAAPIPPGATASLDIAWHHKLPDGPGRGHRMTQRWGDTLVQPTQWFPRVAMYDDLRGWDTELYLGPSEFYNPFGRYDVTIDVPASWLVSGTGTLVNAADVLSPTVRERLARALQSDSVTTIVGPGEAADLLTLTPVTRDLRRSWRFVADSVNDFAWAASPKYVWQATRATIPGRGPVPIHMLFLPDRARLFADAGPITRHALEFYSKLWFPYPFPQLTLQDGPSAGMEYPMVINSNRGAADHETGHQWWPMVVANNETWYGWMDEGFNQYMNILSDADAEGKPPALDGLGQSYGRISGDEAEPPMMWNANYAGPRYYGFTTYQKTPLMLSALGGVVGDSAVQRAHREFAQAWRFRHPSPWDWMFFMNRALGQDLGWFWYSWLFTTDRTDGAIESVTPAGWGTRVVVRQDGQMPSPVVLDVTLAPGTTFRLPANARRLDDTTVRFTWPVDVWFAGARRFTATLPVPGARVQQVQLDPERRFPDREPGDNTWTLPPTR